MSHESSRECAAVDAEVVRLQRDLTEARKAVLCPNCGCEHEPVPPDFTALQASLSEERGRREAAEKERDAEMERVKACEHIAEGDDGWERLANICPSTLAVATLRNEYDEAVRERDLAGKRALYRTDCLIEQERNSQNLQAKLKKAEAFKKWTHDYLDGKGVPATIEDSHLANGCRIGGRMDWVFARLESAEKSLSEANEKAERELAAERGLRLGTVEVVKQLEKSLSEARERNDQLLFQMNETTHKLEAELEAERKKPCEYGHLQAKAEKERDESVAREREAKDEIERLKKRLELQKLMADWGDELIDERDALRSRCARLEGPLKKVAETQDFYDNALAEAKAKRDKRVYELTEVAYLAQLRDDLKALSDPGTDWGRAETELANGVIQVYEKKAEEARAREARLVEALTAIRRTNGSCFCCHEDSAATSGHTSYCMNADAALKDSGAQSWLSDRLSAAKLEGEREAYKDAAEIAETWKPGRPSAADDWFNGLIATLRKKAQSSQAEGAGGTR